MSKKTSAAALKEELNSIQLKPVGGFDREPINYYYNYGEVSKPNQRQMKQGTTIIGTYQGRYAITNKFTGKEDFVYKIRTEEDGLVGINGSAALNRLLPKVAFGATVQVTYNGKEAFTTKTGSRASAHSFSVAADKHVE